MNEVPETVKRYAVLLITGAMLLLAQATVQVETEMPGPRGFIVLAAFVFLIALAWRFPLHIADKVKLVVDTSFVFAAVLLFPPPWSFVAVGAGIMLAHLLFRRTLVDMAVNTGIAVIKTFAAQWIYLLLGGTIPPRFDGWTVLMPLATAGVSMLLTERLLVAGAVALHLKADPVQIFVQSLVGEWKEDTALLLLGVLTALVVEVQPWALALTLVPIALVYYSLRNGLRVKALTRDVVESMADFIDQRDPYTAGHSRRVAQLAEQLALEMGLPWDEVQTIRAAARVHDLGKIGIDSYILQKPNPLTDTEWAIVHQHPVIGAELVSRFPEFARGAEYIRYHHERWDGRGYPYGLRGEEIPLGAQIIAVADAFDAMTSERPYRKALSVELVIEEFRRGAGLQWNEEVVAALLRVLDRHSTEREWADFPLTSERMLIA